MAARWLAESAAAIAHGGQRASQRQHRLDAFADSEHVAGSAEAHGIAEEIAHRPSRRVDRRLAERRREAARVEPGAMRAGQMAERSVTAAIIAGQVSVDEPSSGR